MRLSLSDHTLSMRNRKIIPILVVVLAGILFTLWAIKTKPAPALYISLGWLLTISLLLWWGNRFLTHQLDRTLPWNQWGNMRFFIHLTLGLIFLLILVNMTYLVI